MGRGRGAGVDGVASGKLRLSQGPGDQEAFSEEGFDCCENKTEPAGPDQDGNHVSSASGHEMRTDRSRV